MTRNVMVWNKLVYSEDIFDTDSVPIFLTYILRILLLKKGLYLGCHQI